MSRRAPHQKSRDRPRTVSRAFVGGRILVLEGGGWCHLIAINLYSQWPGANYQVKGHTGVGKDLRYENQDTIQGRSSHRDIATRGFIESLLSRVRKGQEKDDKAEEAGRLASSCQRAEESRLRARKLG